MICTVIDYIHIGFTEDQDKEKDKETPRITDVTAAWPSGEEDEREEKKKEKTPISSSQALSRFSFL